MTRFSASAMTTAAEQPHVPYVMFADLDFLSGHVRVNSSNIAIEFSGNVYAGGGQLVGMGDVVESAALNPEKISLSLAGVDNALVSTVLTESYHGRSATLYIVFLNAAGEMVATPPVLWEGSMDSMGIETDVGSSTIELIAENRLVIWNQASNLLYSDEHQGLLTANPTDSFFNRSPELVDKTVKWGGQSVGTGTGRSGSRAGIK